MAKFSKFIIVAFLIGVILIAGCAQKQAEEGKKDGEIVVPKPAVEETLKIGFVSPLTGDAASYGEVEKEVLAIALDEINNAGGIAGKKVEVIYEDGKCEGKSATTAANKLIYVDKVKVIMGGGCSGETLAMAPIANKANVIIFSSYSTSPKITDAGDFIFRNAYSDADSGRVTAELVAEKYKTVGILSEQTDFAQAFKEVFIKDFTAKGGKVVADETFLPESRDFRTALQKIIAAKPEAIWIDPQTDKTGGMATKQAREIGWTGPLFGNFATPAPGFLELAGNAAEGMVFAGDPEVSPEASEKTKELFEKYRAKYGKDPAYAYPMAARYDAIYILKGAIEAVGYDGEKIRDYLYSMPEYDGALGKYKFDKNGDVVGVEMTKKVIKDGKPVPYIG